MVEIVEVKTVLGIRDHDIGETVMRALAENEALPPDFQFRLLMVEPEDRLEVARTDILHAMGYGEPSGHGYLTARLPACVFVPISASLDNIIKNVAVDYYQKADLHWAAVRAAKLTHLAQSSWGLYVRHLDPELFAQTPKMGALDGTKLSAGDMRGWSNSRFESQRGYILSRVLLRDDALLPIYYNERPIPGHGSSRRALLHYMLLDNHPEFGPDPS